MSKNVLFYLEIAITAAIALTLSYIPLQLFNAGIDISLGFIPIAILAVRRGVIPAFIAGALWGSLSIFVGKAYFLTTTQVIIEYPVAFAFGSLVGLFSLQIKTSRYSTFWIILASFVGATARWSWHFVAGVVFWGSYAPKGTNPYLYSLAMNGTSCLINTVVLSVLLIMVVKKAKFLLDPVSFLRTT